MADDDNVCPRCRRRCDPQEFAGPAGSRLKSCRTCRDVAREGNRSRRARIGPAGVRAANLRDKYRISVEEYDALRARQS